MGPWFKAVMGGQDVLTMTDKFQPKWTLKGPWAGIWLGNYTPDFGIDHEYMVRNCVWVDLRSYRDVNGERVDRLDSRIVKHGEESSSDEEEEEEVAADSQISWDTQ